MPRTLVLHLKRYDRHGNKLARFVSYPMHALNMWPHLSQSLAQKWTSEHCVYDLCALVVHTGRSHSRGHYQTYAYRNEHWYLFDDRRVTPVSETVVAQQKAYILFYTKRPVARTR